MNETNPTETPKSSLRRRGRAPAILLVLVVLAGIAWLAIRFLGREPAGPADTPAATAPAAEAPDTHVDVTLPPEEVRSTLEAVSSNEDYRRWLAQPDLVRRAAVVIDNLGEGVSPRAELGFLAPKQAFSAAARGGREVIAPASYARYDRFADAIASLDAGALAKAYDALRPALQTAYRALGYPQGSIDAALSRALGRLEGAPVRDEPVAVEAKGGIWLFADPQLERLPAVEKHLLRMGPRNTRLVQEKAKALREAAGLTAAGSSGAGAP